jgi:C-methyltransferase C-terminal domain/Putative zinc binding domain/Methyltransferase domain
VPNNRRTNSRRNTDRKISVTSIETPHCRVCRSASLVSVLDLGEQALTGVFPHAGEMIGGGPLNLAWCGDCNLLQLRHSYDPDTMYGKDYGYRSGLNQSMVQHLNSKAKRLEEMAGLEAGDVILDIGCNDGTLLSGYETEGLTRLGIDPTADKFREFHPENITAVAEFFNASTFQALSSKKAKIITSIAMFYDLEDPVSFARDVAACLADDGVWHLEQSYMPSMLRACSYDTVCHEHIEYYSLHSVTRVLSAAGLVPVHVRFNSVNGGSFSVTAMKATAARSGEQELTKWLLGQEDRMNLSSPTPYRQFEERVYRHRADLIALLQTLKGSGASIMGYGASTKGNVMLQFCGITPDLVTAIGEVNPDKFGRVTPGTGIPIVSEQEMHAAKPDYLLVLPWHFREGILRREAEFLKRGGRLIFPLPEIEIVGD